MGKILIVEDEAPIRALVHDVVRSVGYEPDDVADGIIALARFQLGAYDVVITDFMMPKMTGLEVARSVRRMDPHVTVIILSGSVLPIVEVLEEFGFRVLEKPVSIQLLIDAVTQGVAQTHRAREAARL